MGHLLEGAGTCALATTEPTVPIYFFLHFLQAFNNKPVIVCGASYGIGAEIAYTLAKANAALVISARNKQKLDAVAAECRRLGATNVLVSIYIYIHICYNLNSHSVHVLVTKHQSGIGWHSLSLARVSFGTRIHDARG